MNNLIEKAKENEEFKEYIKSQFDEESDVYKAVDEVQNEDVEVKKTEDED